MLTRSGRWSRQYGAGERRLGRSCLRRIELVATFATGFGDPCRSLSILHLTVALYRLSQYVVGIAGTRSRSLERADQIPMLAGLYSVCSIQGPCLERGSFALVPLKLWHDSS